MTLSPCPKNFNFGWDVVADLGRAAQVATIFVPEEGSPRRITFAQVHDRSSRVARLYRSLGLEAGDRVVMVLPRIPAFYEVIVGGIKAGVVSMPGTNLLTARDLKYRVQQTGARAAVVTAGHAEAIDAILDDCPTLKHRVLVGGTREGWTNYEEAVDASSYLTREEAPSTVATDPMLLYFTSGTTSHPKAVVRDHAYAWAHRLTGQHWMDLREGDVHWTLTDTGWAKAAWGLLFPQWSLGATTVLYESARFEPERCLQLIGELGVSTFCAPPTVYRMFAQMDLSTYDLSSLRRSLAAGEPLNPEVIAVWKKATGAAPADGYGQTETVNLVGNTPGLPVRPGSMGKPIPGLDVDIVDEEGAVCPPDEVGQIAVRVPDLLPSEAPLETWPPGLFRGYEQDGRTLTDSFRNGWYYTGDTAWKDKDGYIWFVGRSDDVITSGAYRISPFEVESVLQEHPAVAESAVVAKPDPIRGHIVVAVVVAARDATPSASLGRELQDFCREQTAPYKYPREVHFMDELPKTISGKIRRVELRETLAEVDPR